MRLGHYALVFIVVGAAVAASCRDWDKYDPRFGVVEPTSGPGASAPGGNGGAGGGTGGSGGAGNVPCGTTELLSDDFEDGTIARHWYQDVAMGSSLAEQGGHLVMTLGAGISWTQSGVSTHSFYDLRGRALSVEIVSAPTTVPNVGWSFYLRGTPNGSDRVQFSVNTDIRYENIVADVPTSLGTQQFDMMLHRWLRFRDEAGSLVFESSGDGMTWVPRATVPASDLSFSLEYVMPVLGVGGDPGATTAALEVDNLNGGVAPGGALCPIGTLQDDFEAAQLSRAWMPYYDGMGCSSDVSAGALVFSLEQGFDTGCWRHASRRYRLTGGAITFEPKAVPVAGEGAVMTFSVGEGNNNHVRFQIADGIFEAIEVTEMGWDTVASAPFSVASHRFMRISDASSNISWETSGDGVTWVTQAIRTAQFDTSYTWVGMDAGSFNVRATPLSPSFDNVNTVP